MKPFSAVLSLVSSVLLRSGVLAFIPLSGVQRKPSNNLLPNSFIVELESVSDITFKRSPTSVHETFYLLANNANVGFTVEREFNHAEIFVGVSIKLAGDQDISKISKIDGVKRILPVVMIPRPRIVNKIIPSGPHDPSVPQDTESTHVMTGVDKLHVQGLFGKGTKIGILDTGTDYTHPALGAGFGEGKKIAGGFDFVGDDYNGLNTPVPDPDPLDQCAGHGTHVAGIIGADPDNDFKVSGVAYESTIFSYRIFGCEGSVTDDVIIEALLQGYSDGMDIMTLSLGGADGWTEGMASVVASRLSDRGKIITIAAGNEGSFGSWYTSGPSNGIDVLSIASVDNTVIPIQNATTSDPSHPTIPYFSAIPLPINGSLPIYATSNDSTIVDDACNPLPDDTPDLSRFLVVIRRGTCNFVVKLQNVADKGGKVSLIYDNGSGFAAIDTGNFTTSLIQAADGQFLVSRFAAGANITVAFPQSGRSFDLPASTGGLISDFSSYGPSFDFFFKPAIAAPGGNVLSTFPVPLGSFAVLSGTSMATPFVAGSAALLLQAKGKTADVARGARTRFETTAQKIPSSKDDGDPLQTLTVQGAGLINVFNAIHYKTVVSPGEIILNDTTHFDGSHTITVRNTGSILQRYALSHVPAGTAVTIQPGTIFPSDGPVPLTTEFATVSLSQKTLLVPPSGSATFRATFTAPKGVDKTTFPVYTGFIQIQSNTEILHVAYQGVAAALKDMKVLDNTDAKFGPGVTLPTLLDSNGNPQTNATNYTFVGNDFPALLFRLASGTPRLLIDLVRPDVKLNKREIPSYWTPLAHNGGSFSKVPVVGPLAEFDYQARNSDAPDAADGGFNVAPFSAPTFANNSVIPNGQYRVLLRALKITGDATNEGDYETFLSPMVGVNTPA